MNNRIALRFLLAFAIALTMAAAIWTAFPTPEESGVYDGFMRLHIIANSDSAADQSVKLKVRDKILAVTADITEGCQSRVEVEAAFEGGRERIRAEAVNTLAECGFSYGARVEIGRERYPTREYEGVTLPAGIYSSVRVLLGDGNGKNWWCVLFPPLCTNVSAVREQLIEAGFTEGQIKIITGGAGRYKLKFRIFEIIADLFAHES